MSASTRRLWSEQDRRDGDRWRLFAAVGDAVAVDSVLYPGSFVDIAPSFVFDSVTYVDSDRRTPGFFADEEVVCAIIGEHDGGPESPRINFIHGDYRTDLDLPEEGFDLLISLYAGFVSEHCTGHLRVGGSLLVNPSHGDAAMASIDPRYELAGVVLSGSGNYRVSRSDLDGYLVPTREVEVTVGSLHELGRGIGYTRSPFAYLLTRVR